MSERLPSVSVIIPARNEEKSIARAIRSLAVQQNVREIVAVDDQSRDGTAGILEELTQQIPLLRVIHVDCLPPGWLGKPHAASVGAKNAHGEWLLFTDADAMHLPNSLSEILTRAENARADLLSLSPGQVTLTCWEKAVIPMVYVWLSKRFRFEDVSDPASTVVAANGQYILIRRSAYDRAGGHAMVKAAILEDVALAQRVKSSGGRLLFLPGARWVRTRMYENFSAMWEGWTKNLYLLAGSNMVTLLGTAGEIFLLDFMPLLVVLVVAFASAAGVLKWTWATPVLLAGIGLYLWRSSGYRREIVYLGFAAALAKYRIPGALIFSLLLFRSAWAYRWSHEVTWKGRVYSVSAADHSSSSAGHTRAAT